jgi:hypothetical protein
LLPSTVTRDGPTSIFLSGVKLVQAYNMTSSTDSGVVMPQLELVLSVRSIHIS